MSTRKLQFIPYILFRVKTVGLGFYVDKFIIENKLSIKHVTIERTEEFIRKVKDFCLVIYVF